MTLGLDLKGGVHLVLRVQTDDALKLETETTVERLRDSSRAAWTFAKADVVEPNRVPLSRAFQDDGAYRDAAVEPTPSSTGPRSRAATPIA